MTTLTDDDLRALFDDHIDGVLDDATTRAVDDALRTRPALADEYRALAQTLSALRALPRPQPPADLAARVRVSLGAPPGEPAHSNVIAGPASWWTTSRVATGIASFAVAAAVAGVFVISAPPSAGRGADTGMLGAAVGADAVHVEWSGPAFANVALIEIAQSTGMQPTEKAGEFVGDRAAAAAFFVEVKSLAVTMGSDLQGQVPQHADRIVVQIR
jgi:anti-sigma factor RsiW